MNSTPRYLLLGAGFSRNWGGWLATEAFEYLIGHREISSNRYLCEVLWSCTARGGFEEALGVVRIRHTREPSLMLENLTALNNAVRDMFQAMNDGFSSLPQFAFSPLVAGRGIRHFLTKFDAIFTLNQDTLLEQHYFGMGVESLSVATRGWMGAQMPGVRIQDAQRSNMPTNWAPSVWVEDSADFLVDPSMQVFYKLHGSSNWRSRFDADMLLVGNNKLQDISQFPVLSRYLSEFERALCTGRSKLMVIGYGFRDSHINTSIALAVETHGLRFFNINPDGAGQAEQLRRNAQGAIQQTSDLERIFVSGLCGASRRSIREICEGDNIEFQKVNEFFEG